MQAERKEEPPLKCPICNVDLVMSERQGIEIDYCPQCRGVWLDRGELDKIVERSAAQFGSPAASPARSSGKPERRYDDDDDRRFYDRDDDRYYGKKKKRESFLSDLFDFGD